MRQRAFFSGLALGVGLATVALLGADPLSGQSNDQPELNRTQFGLGYVANAPEAMIGGGAYGVFPVLGGIGIYVDGKFDSSDPTDERGYDPSITADEVEDKVPGATFISKEDSWKSFNLAVVRPVTPYLMVYGGAGWANARYVHLFEDNTGRAFLGSALYMPVKARSLSFGAAVL